MGTSPSLLHKLIDRAASAYAAGPAEAHARIVCEHAAQEQIGTAVCYWNRPEDSPAFVAQSYIGLLQMIANLRTDSYLSVKAPAFGFDAELLNRIIEEAQQEKSIVHFDAMAPDTVDRTFALIENACRFYSNIGYTLPGRWRRSVRDVDSAVDLGLRVRVVKGEWAGLNGDDMDPRDGYTQVIQRLASRRARHVAVATHDVDLASNCLDRLKSAGVSCEIELLYGLPKRAMLKLARKYGVRARIYVPYGQAGLPYRLKDSFRNPRIFTWFARDLVRGSSNFVGCLTTYQRLLPTKLRGNYAQSPSRLPSRPH